MFANLLSSLLLVLVTNSVLSALISRRQSLRAGDAFVELIPFEGDKYFLSLQHSDGSRLQEIVEKTAPRQYKVEGRLRQPGFVPAGRLILTYGRHDNGYPIRLQPNEQIPDYTLIKKEDRVMYQKLNPYPNNLYADQQKPQSG